MVPPEEGCMNNLLVLHAETMQITQLGEDCKPKRKAVDKRSLFAPDTKMAVNDARQRRKNF